MTNIYYALNGVAALIVELASRQHYVGIGPARAGTNVRLLIRDLEVRVINLTTGEILRELTIDPTRN